MNYDPKTPSTFIPYLDMNNLYGWAMSEYLPYERFKWLKNVDEFDVMSISEKSPIEYLLEVDLRYTNKLHELHNDYPLDTEKRAVSNDMLSKYCKKVADKYEIKVGDLQLYLSLGMKLTKIHRVLELKQCDWMNKYIDFNTEKRMNAANDFEKYFFKLMINSV